MREACAVLACLTRAASGRRQQQLGVARSSLISLPPPWVRRAQTDTAAGLVYKHFGREIVAAAMGLPVDAEDVTVS